MACVLGLHQNLKGTPISVISATIYDNFARLAWALALSWVVIACQLNIAGPIKDFLELGLWAPFSRLAYCSYLTHFFVLVIYESQLRRPLHFVSTIVTYIHDAVPIFIITFVFSLFWSCGFELSFGRLDKMLIDAVFGR
ncbi:unnamed protein product [Anisakis simplex]|uniref:Acyltransferase 3 domain-containing protein n=1 Tax=Anisakis simplex TaxID=6269 RepID=A0A3P6RP97_ANISI|nr:unnamed protein product [Anisakis simplex]